MSRARLAFIESNTSGTGRLFARAAAVEGFRPILVSADPGRYEYVREDRLDVLQVNTSSRQDLLNACRSLARRDGLVGVMSSSDYFIDAAATLASALGLPGPGPDAVRIVRDKLAQRVRLAAAGINVPRFRCAKSAKEAVASACRLGFPVVVKPVRGSGSFGVRLCLNTEEVATHASHLLRSRRNERGQRIPHRILVEELAVGPEYSIETFNKSIVGFTAKHLGALPHFVEIGHDYPAVLSSQAGRILGGIVRRALEALRLGWGPAHVEMRVTTRGPLLIEVNPRLCGGYIPELVRLASGLDLISACIKLVVGKEPNLRARINRYASIRFLLPAGDGVLTSTRGIHAALATPGVVQVSLYRRPGESVRRHGDFRDRIGHVIAVAPSAAPARFAADRARGRIRIAVKTK